MVPLGFEVGLVFVLTSKFRGEGGVLWVSRYLLFLRYAPSERLEHHSLAHLVCRAKILNQGGRYEFGT